MIITAGWQGEQLRAVDEIPGTHRLGGGASPGRSGIRHARRDRTYPVPDYRWSALHQLAASPATVAGTPPNSPTGVSWPPWPTAQPHTFCASAWIAYR